MNSAVIRIRIDIVIETGAGQAARIADADYVAAGASIAPDARTALENADIVLKVRGPQGAETALLKKGAVVAALLAPHSEKDSIQGLASQGVTAFAMELLPRISRAQAMDVLSSQANLAGYKAVIDAAALSYLGLGGGRPETAEWGRMLTYAQNELAIAPQLAFLPGICIAVTALGFTLFGEALREAMDPRTRAR